MRPSFLVLYSVVATQAATALLLAGALYVLGRYYPRNYLKVWVASWLSEAVHVAAGLAALDMRTSGPSVAPFWPTLATWVSQGAGYAHAALLVLGASALYHRRDAKTSLPVILAISAVVAVLPTLLVPQDATQTGADFRMVVRFGVMLAVTSGAAFAAALRLRGARSSPGTLGLRWVWLVLLALGAQRLFTLVLSMTARTDGRFDVGILQVVPLGDIVLTAVLGIATAIALAEDEQDAIQRAAAREVDAERRARMSGASLVSALAAVPDLVAVFDTDARLVAWNPAFQTFVTRYGQSPPAIGTRVVDVMPHTTADDWSERIETLLAGGDLAFEAAFEFPDVAPEYFDVSARPMRDASEDLVGGVIVARDVTERRKLEQQLQQAQRLDTVGRLAGGIAHDFNNLLTAILSSASVARECLPADHEVQADLADVQLAGERATQLTKQLLAFARRQPVSQQPIALNDHVAPMERMLSRLVGPEVALHMTLGENLWHVRADGPQLEQVLVNVVVNARDAMPTGGRLTVRTGNRLIDEGAIVLPRPMPAGEYVEIVVSDTGSGMDEVTLAHVFEPFYTTKPVGQGTGLGLAMCYGIIRQHHGVIWIESSPGRGTTVNILLPRYDGELPVVASGRPMSSTPVATSGGTETVLLVEDEPQVRAVAARALRAAGYRVLEATNGRDGVQVARRERDAIDLIVSDVVMPEMGGKEMVELARHFLPSVAVLFVSGFTAGSFPLPSDDPSASIFLQKPFTPQELVAMVRQVLDRHAAQRETRATVATS